MRSASNHSIHLITMPNLDQNTIATPTPKVILLAVIFCWPRKKHLQIYLYMNIIHQATYSGPNFSGSPFVKYPWGHNHQPPNSSHPAHHPIIKIFVPIHRAQHDWHVGWYGICRILWPWLTLQQRLVGFRLQKKNGLPNLTRFWQPKSDTCTKIKPLNFKLKFLMAHPHVNAPPRAVLFLKPAWDTWWNMCGRSFGETLVIDMKAWKFRRV